VKREIFNQQNKRDQQSYGALTASKLFSVSLVLALIHTSAAMASSGHSEPRFSDLTFYWINFVLYVAIMAYILRKPIRTGWAARVERIKQSVTRSATDVEVAERELNAIEALSKSLPAEQERIKQQLLEQANLEAEELIKDAHQRAQRIRHQAKELVFGETRSAESAFKRSLVSRAIAIAKDRFGKGELVARDAVYTARALSRADSLIKH
jgi:F0F1-type ATP synthase membrane subunit b/b'